MYYNLINLVELNTLQCLSLCDKVYQTNQPVYRIAAFLFNSSSNYAN